MTWQRGGRPIAGPPPRGGVRIFSKSGKVPNVLVEALDSNAVYEIVTDLDLWPATCDFYVTSAALCVRTERAAARMCALTIVMPEQRVWLAGKLRQWRAEQKTAYVFVARRQGDDGT